jgi:hypothetical protein
MTRIDRPSVNAYPPFARALFRLLDARMAAYTKGLPIAFIPEKNRVAAVRFDVVYNLRRRHVAARQTLRA